MGVPARERVGFDAVGRSVRVARAVGVDTLGLVDAAHREAGARLLRREARVVDGIGRIDDRLQQADGGMKEVRFTFCSSPFKSRSCPLTPRPATLGEGEVFSSSVIDTRPAEPE